MKPLNIVSNTKYFIGVSIVIILIGLVFLFMNGLNLGIDFIGGTIMTVNIGQQFKSEDIDHVLKSSSIEGAQVVQSGEGAVKTKAIIRMKDFADPEQENAIRANLVKGIQAVYPKAALETIEKVGPVAGRELTRNAFFSIVIACGLMLVYIWFRFELLSGVAAVIALAHDVLFMIAAAAILRVPVNSPFIAAILTIVGYSINDTIVVFDRIRENNKKFSRKQKARADVVDLSITETMARSINTVLTTLITITAVYLLGVESIKEFALPLIVGLVSGCYSSIFIASPLWCILHERIYEKVPTVARKA